MSIRDMVFELALMCKRTECDKCELAWEKGTLGANLPSGTHRHRAGSCKLRTATLMEAAQSYLSAGRDRGEVWIKYETQDDAVASRDELKTRLPEEGPYVVNMYCTEGRMIYSPGRADDKTFQILVTQYGEDRVRLRLIPEKGL